MSALLRPSSLVRWCAVALCGVALHAAAACSAAGGGGAPLGTGGSAGSTAGSGGSSAGSAGTAGSAGLGATGGDGSGATGGSISVDSGTGGSGATDSGLTDGPGNVQDAQPDVPFTCTDSGVPYAPGPYARACAAPTDDECNGADVGVPNGQYGNGYDDDCDGKVDEGCECGATVGAGETKTCWLISGSQPDPSGKAVGWCAQNSVGTVACKTLGTGEFATRVWDGECRGAQPPYASDVCANGDYDCDGTVGNSKTPCTCETVEVECPTGIAQAAPYPDPTNLPFIDGAAWIKSGNPGSATNWKWTVTGGDCDNILPHPSFQVFATQAVSGANFVGVQATGLGPGSNQTGLVAGPAATIGAKLFVAFALSGDYLVKGEWDLGGKHYSCTQKVWIRAPGIRAEACWTPMPNDVDLHLARLQGGNCTHGWFDTCAATNGDDAYYAQKNPNWGYPISATTACHGWGSRRLAAEACANPRLDLDNIQCAVNVKDPNNKGLAGAFGFCAAENINLDRPNNGERFAVATHAYGTTGNVKPHVNIYCNGARRLSLGYDPTNGTNYPVLLDGTQGQAGGDFWEAAVVQAIVDGSGTLTDCAIQPIHSVVPKPTKDGSPNVCVDTNPRNGSPGTAADWKFIQSGGFPTTADQLCWH